MKTNQKNLFLGLLAAAGLMAAGCDHESEGGDPDVIEGSNTYLALDIKMSDATTKALDGGYEDYANEAEHKVETICALFFNSDGSFLTVGTKWEGNESNGSTNGGNNVESGVKPVLTLGPTTIKSTVKMLLFVNDQCHASWEDESGNAVGYFSSLINKPLSEVLKLTTSTAPSKAGTFEMTNSAYLTKDGAVVQAVDVPASCFKEDISSITTDDYFTVYVERTVAKVKMQETIASALSSTTISSDAPFLYSEANYYPITVNGAPASFTLDGKQTAFAVTVLGWCPNGVNGKGYLVKHICADGLGTDGSDFTAGETKTYAYRDANGTLKQWASWNDAGNCRSYWAEDWNYAEDGLNNDGTTSGKSTETTLTFKSLYTTTTSGTSSTVTAALDKKSDPFYIYENTVAQENAKYEGGEDHPNVTTMLVSAQIVPLNGSFTNGLNFTLTSKDSPVGDAVDLFRADGVFYTAAGYKAKALSGGYIQTDTDDSGSPVYAAITESMFKEGGTLENMTWSAALVNATSDLKHYDGVKYTVSHYELTDDDCVPIYLLVNDSYSKLENLNDLNSNLTNKNFPNGVEYFKDGKCFYQVPIEQPVDKKETETGKIYGVVRNHSYVLTLNTISSIGAPDTGVDEEVELIPGKDQYYYLGCTLNVLAWRNVTQNVSF